MYTIRPCSAGVIGFDGPHADNAIADIAATAGVHNRLIDLVKWPKNISMEARVRGGR